jgi:DNA-binding FadR family transcriptional regulator
LLSDELRAVPEYQAIVRACQRKDAELAAKHARQLVQIGAGQIEKMAASHMQRQAVNNGDLFTV